MPIEAQLGHSSGQFVPSDGLSILNDGVCRGFLNAQKGRYTGDFTRSACRDHPVTPKKGVTLAFPLLGQSPTTHPHRTNTSIKKPKAHKATEIYLELSTLRNQGGYVTG